ncbi:hypothetical protein GCM10010909_35010 [Acidocella aquatica]|uniref:Uncharacterized protein n=1 Tax=Acidocella aquatica TaxID=1922313 RepID=A0ABQ6AFD4_9PROT|nr:hypothetical protein GCM10010909_35010 [Acidocella aquatica]
MILNIVQNVAGLGGQDRDFSSILWFYRDNGMRHYLAIGMGQYQNMTPEAYKI